jgi:Family of unknown function (DUF6283)
MTMAETSHRPVMCHDCPWRVNSKRFVWSIERFHDLRIGMLQTIHGKVMICHHSGHHLNHQPGITCQGFLEVTKTQHVRVWLARIHAEAKPSTEQTLLFPSFEAMADANGAGLFDWIAQLEPGETVVHFKYGLARDVLEVRRNHDGIVTVQSDGVPYRFNCLGYELQTVIDSRILPATASTLQLINRIASAT